MNVGKAQIGVLAEKYRELAIIKGNELLMPVKVAIEFLKDMTEHGEIVVGCDGWRYVDYDRGWIVQDLDVELSLGTEETWEEMTPSENTALMLPFLAGIPDEIDFVSFQFKDYGATDALMDMLREGRPHTAE